MCKNNAGKLNEPCVFFGVAFYDTQLNHAKFQFTILILKLVIAKCIPGNAMDWNIKNTVNQCTQHMPH